MYIYILIKKRRFIFSISPAGSSEEEHTLNYQ